MKRTFFYLSLFGVAVLLVGCFTGVESVPKITPKELKKQNVSDTPEQHVLDSVKVVAPRDWAPGKEFYIADNRASRVAWRIEPPELADSLAGKTVTLVAIEEVPTLTDKKEIQLNFIQPDSGILEYRTGMNRLEWQEAENYTLPHMIDLEIVDRVRKSLVGRTFYILPARRYGASGNDTVGVRYQPVEIKDVVPATEATPIRVIFADKDGNIASVLMTLGDETTSRRNLETLFSITDPRLRYRQIDDEVWQLIVHSKIRAGMTPLECRLALGSPDSYTRIPTTAGMAERWTYNNGVYLLFEDGVLTRYRL